MGELRGATEGRPLPREVPDSLPLLIRNRQQLTSFGNRHPCLPITNRAVITESVQAKLQNEGEYSLRGHCQVNCAETFLRASGGDRKGVMLIVDAGLLSPDPECL